MDRLFLRMDPQTRQVRSKGIPAFGLHYWSAELRGIERIDRTGHSIEYNFRYDPADISRISLYRNGEWIGDGMERFCLTDVAIVEPRFCCSRVHHVWLDVRYAIAT